MRDNAASVEPAPRRAPKEASGGASRLRLALLCGLLISSVIVPFAPFADPYFLTILSLGLVAAMSGIGLTLLLGVANQFAFTSAAFLGLGAYASAYVGVRWQLSIVPILIIATVIGAAAGSLLGMIVGKHSGFFLAMVTVAFMYMLDHVWRNAKDVTGGVQGLEVPELSVLPMMETPLVGTGRHAESAYYVGIAAFWLVVFGSTWIKRSRLGRSWRVTGYDPNLAQALGVSTYWAKVKCFGVSSAIFALAGGVFAQVNSRVFPEMFGFGQLITDVLVVVLGGLGSVWGAAVAGVVLVFVREELRAFVGISELVFGGMLLLSVILAPRGIYGIVASRLPSMREKEV